MRNKIIKTFFLILLFCLLCCTLCGCWNYRGLNDLTIVMGTAIDKDDSGNYILTSDTIDLSRSNKQAGVKTVLVESSGKTIFEAVRNAKKRLSGRLYFGNMEILVISNKIAKEDGLMPILDWFLRDSSPRENIQLAISQDQTAADILKNEGLGNSIVSLEIKQILSGDPKTNSTVRSMPIYQTYDMLKTTGMSLTLPALHSVKNADQTAVEVNGLAVFKRDKLVGYLTPEESFFYLFTVDQIKGGEFSININDPNTETLSLEIFKNRTKSSYTIKNNKIIVKLKIATNVAVDESETNINVSNQAGIMKVQNFANHALAQGITDVVKKVQTEYSSDIFGFGDTIHKKDYKTWRKLKGNWDQTIKNVEVQVEPKFIITNTSSTKKM